ncbi:unnamed protein product, partial [Rotaria socialis]
MFRINFLIVFSSIIFIFHATGVAARSASLNILQIGSINPGFTAGTCPTSPDGYQYGWHFKFRGTQTSFISISCSFEKAGKITKMVQVPNNQHAYVFTPGPDKLQSASAVVNGVETMFLLSNICTPPTPTSSMNTSKVLTTTTRTTTTQPKSSAKNSAERASGEQASPGKASGEQASRGKASGKQASRGKASGEQASPGKASREQASPGKASG